MSTEESENEDPRVDHIKYVTLKALDIDEGPWGDLMWKEDNQAIVKDFLDSPATLLLLICFDRSGKLVLLLDFPERPPMPKLMAYFLKYKNIIISMTGFKQEIMCGNLSNIPLKHYQVFYEQVIVPIACNPLNNTRWPYDISCDINFHFKDFQKILSNCVGLAQGKTVLLIPETAKAINFVDVDSLTSDSLADEQIRQILDSISEMVIDWTHLVNEVLELTSEHILDQKKDQGPATEISFWKCRKENFEFIHSQIDDKIVKKMVIAFEKTKCCYLPAFKKVLQDIAEGLAEAEDIYEHLENMSDALQQLESCEFETLMDILPSTIETITASWIQSKYYSSTPSRVAILMKKTCNLLIKRVQEFLNPKKLFTDDRSKTSDNVKLSKDVLNLFIKSYCDCRDTMTAPLYMKLYPWEFPDERVFDRLEKFIQRLDDIQGLFEAANVYCRIPRHKIGGVQQTSMKIKLNSIYSEFCENYKIFEEGTSNPLDLESEAFSEDCEKFHSKLCDLDCRLGAAICYGCGSCYPSEDAFKLMQELQDLVDRPLVNKEFKNCVSSLIKTVHDELIRAKEMYDKQISSLRETGKCPTYKNLPPVSGALRWSSDLKMRLTTPIESLQNIKLYFATPEDAHLVLELFTEMEELLYSFEIDVFKKWVQTVSETIPELLDNSLFTRDEDENIILNFDVQLCETAQEIKHMKCMKKELPDVAIQFDELSETLLRSWSFLSSTIRWHNYLAENLVEFEKILISQQWEEIESLLKTGQEETWSSPGLKEYSEKIYEIMKAVFESVILTKENVKEVERFIETWNTTPMYIRQTPTSLVDFKIFMTPRVKEKILAVKQTSEKMQYVLEENLTLFKCDPNSEDWKSYIMYLETIIETGLKNGIECSLNYLIDNTDAGNKKLSPFYKVFMSLDEEITFSPPLNTRLPGNLLSLFNAVIDKIYSLSSEIKRMSDPNSDYSIEMYDCHELTNAKNILLQHIKVGAQRALYKTEEFRPYADLWLQDINDILEDFVTYGPVQDTRFQDTFDEETANISLSLTMNPPTEEEFRSQISQFDLLYRKVDDMKPIIAAQSWLVLDVSMFKDRLLAIIRKWISEYKHKLIEQKSEGKLRKVEKDDGD